MLRSRAANSLASTYFRSTIANKRFISVAGKDGANRTSEEEVITKTLFRASDSAFIRTWTFPESMRDAFAIIRALERKYGAVKEFKFYRDFEVPSKYQLLIQVAFRDSDSQARIPEDAEELRVVLPPEFPEDQPGGIGLADIEEYLSSTKSALEPTPKHNPASTLNIDNVMADVIGQTQAKAESDNAERVINCRISRAHTGFATPSHVAPYFSPRAERDAIARQILNWGGFHDFSPIEKDTSLPDKDFFGSPNIEHFRMRRCLRRAAKYLRVPNPYEYSPEHLPGSVVTKEDVSESEWEPLSGSNSLEQGHDTLSATVEDEQIPLNATLPLASTEPTPKPITALPPSSERKSQAKELAAQLRAARSLARQVAEEQRKHPKPTATPTSVQAEESVLEEETLRGTAADPEISRQEASEKPTDSRSGDGGMMGKFKNAWGGLF